MERIKLSYLINIDLMQKMADNLYSATGLPIGIIDVDGTVLVEAGWQEICTRFHRVHPEAGQRCLESDRYIQDHLADGDYIEYKCRNNLWDIAMPVIVGNEHIASVFLGQFLYDDENLDEAYFRIQAREFGFVEEEYINALKRVPIFSRQKVRSIIEYYKGLVEALADSSTLKLQYIRTNEMLQQNEARLRKFFDSIQDLVFVIDREGAFIGCQYPAGAKLYLPEESFMGKKFKDIMPAEATDLLTKAIQTLENEGSILPFDYSLEIDNKTMWFSAQVSKVVNEIPDKEDYYLVISRDVTERKEMERELLKAKLEAEEANNAKSAFIANISHELRTPLTVILSTVQLFQMHARSNSEVQHQKSSSYYAVIKQNCQRLLRLVNNLIDVTKIDAGYMQLNLKNLNIVSIVESITMSVADYARGKNIEVQFDTEMEERVMAFDPDKIERIMLNLLSNAIKFTRRNGSILVSISEEPGKVLISVKDTGIGIPGDKKEQIFERFHQVEATLTRSHEGSGIGLSLVKSLVDMHGGVVRVDSELGKGSEFIIQLPVKVLDSKEYCHYEESIENIDQYIERLSIEFSDIYL